MIEFWVLARNLELGINAGQFQSLRTVCVTQLKLPLPRGGFCSCQVWHHGGLVDPAVEEQAS